MRRRSTYKEITRLDDGKWHSVRELETVSRYPNEWVRELERDDAIELSADGTTPIIRLKGSRLSAP
jgi:hypothetical protein